MADMLGLIPEPWQQTGMIANTIAAAHGTEARELPRLEKYGNKELVRKPRGSNR